MKLFDVYPLNQIEPVKAEGCYIWDKDGKKYLDLYGGHAVISIGHTHPHYVSLLKNQLDKIGFYSNSVLVPMQNQLAEKLGRLSGCEDYNLFLCNSGAEANENALKVASFFNKKKKIISFKKSFHGRTSAAVAITDNPKIVAPVNAGHEVVFLELNDIDSVEKELMKGDVCAVIIEGIQGIGGINIPTDEFLKGLELLCLKHDVILILDEVQSGYGRSGKFFAHQYADIKPDIISVAKGMGNGFPIGGILISPKFKAEYGMIGTTFGGNYLACAAGIAVLDVMEEECLIENADLTGSYLLEMLSLLPKIKEVRGKGLMIGLEFDFEIKDLRNKLLFEHKIFTGFSGSKIIRLLPPLSLKVAEADCFIDALKDEFGKI